MEIEQAFEILDTIDNGKAKEAVKKVKSELNFYKRSFEGVKEQAMKQFAEITILNKKIDGLKKTKVQADNELQDINSKLRERNNILTEWYSDHMEELDEILNNMRTDFDYMKEKLQEVEQ